MLFESQKTTHLLLFVIAIRRNVFRFDGQHLVLQLVVVVRQRLPFLNCEKYDHKFIV